MMHKPKHFPTPDFFLAPQTGPARNLWIFLIWLTPLFLSSFCSTLTASRWSFDGGGSFKSIFQLQNLNHKNIYRDDQNYLNEERLRLQAVVSSPHLRLEIADETFLFYQKHNPTTVPIPDFSPMSAWNPKWTWFTNKETTIYNRIDRAFLQLTYENVQLITGKQVIAIGVGQIFNAVAQMQRYPLVFIDPEYPKTEDAVTVIWSGNLQFEARYLPKNPGQEKDNFHLRLKGNKKGFDVALTGGRSDDKNFVGFETAGNLGEALLRAELVGYTQRGKDYAQSLLGIDYVFSPRWSTKLEVFYNGFGESSSNTLGAYPHRAAPFRGTWYAGNFTTWEIHPLLKANLVSIVNLKDPSALFHLYLNYSISNSLDLLTGQFYNCGKETSEFGGKLAISPTLSLGQPDITYAALRWYF